MQLVLLRHAKAEDQTLIIEDRDRELTAKGRKKARAVAKGLRHLLAGFANIEIWTSPAKRSLQTAEIMAEELNGAAISEFMAIYAGSLDELAPNWNGYGADTAIIVIGHEPHLGIWGHQLADISIPFKKCAAAAFTIDDPAIISGRLQWFAMPKTLIALGESQD